MDRFELVEKLVKSTGVGYEDAKAALEACGWDLLDAAVWLEKNGKIENKSNHFTTNPEQQQEQQKQQEEERMREERRKTSTGSTVGSSSSGNRIFHTILTKARQIIMDNELVICKNSGEIFLEIPIWLAVVLLVVAFWPFLIVLVLVFILGFRFRLHGPDLGSEKVNRILSRAENAAGDFIDRMKNPRSSQNSGYYDATKKPAGNTKDEVIDYNEPQHKE